MPTDTSKALTNHFDFMIKGQDGRDFMELYDLQAEVEITDDECAIVRVLGIFAETKDRKTGILNRSYLDPKHQLWADIEAHILDNEESLMEAERESQGLYWHTPRTVSEAEMFGVGEWRRVGR